jgi:hypothetical protein
MDWPTRAFIISGHSCEVLACPPGSGRFDSAAGLFYDSKIAAQCGGPSLPGGYGAEA